MRRGFFAYPWDLLDEGPEAAVEQMVTRWHCDSLLLNAIYHHARLLRPRWDGPKVLERAEAAAGFAPDRNRYRGPLLPPVDQRLVEGRVLERAREAAARHGTDLGLWVVGLHNSTLGRRHPVLTMCNCFGDRYAYALCPSSEAVQWYLRGLVDDLVSQFAPDRIVLEAIGYLGMRHGVHHEMFFVNMSEPLELLLALCFCDSCVNKAAQAGIDGEALCLRVCELAESLLRREGSEAGSESGTDELASLLVEVPDLWHYLAVRAETIAALVAELSQVPAAGGAKLEVIPASFQRPVSRAWLEGASLGLLGARCDGILVPAYWSRADEVASDLHWAASMAPGATLSAGLNACDPGLSGPGPLAGLVQSCEAARCSAVYYYNYGLLTEQRLEWVAAANRATGE